MNRVGAVDRFDRDQKTLAIDALGWLAERPDDFLRFLGETGTDMATVRQMAGTQEFAVGLFDYLLSNEAILIALSEHLQRQPANVAAEMRTLVWSGVE
jgi:hypothetical protein